LFNFAEVLNNVAFFEKIYINLLSFIRISRSKFKVVLSLQIWVGQRPTINGMSVTERRCMSALVKGIGNDTKTGDWVDQNCDAQMYYICERGKFLKKYQQLSNFSQLSCNIL